MKNPRGRPKGMTKAKMAAIREDFLDYLRRCQPNRSLENMSKEFRVSPATLSKWVNEAGFKRWF